MKTTLFFPLFIFSLFFISCSTSDDKSTKTNNEFKEATKLPDTTDTTQRDLKKYFPNDDIQSITSITQNGTSLNTEYFSFEPNTIIAKNQNGLIKEKTIINESTIIIESYDKNGTKIEGQDKNAQRYITEGDLVLDLQVENYRFTCSFVNTHGSFLISSLEGLSNINTRYKDVLEFECIIRTTQTFNGTSEILNHSAKQHVFMANGLGIIADQTQLCYNNQTITIDNNTTTYKVAQHNAPSCQSNKINYNYIDTVEKEFRPFG